MITASTVPAFVAAVAAALAIELALADTHLFLPTILALILLFGMPHGALDVVLGRRLWSLTGAWQHAVFMLIYLSIAGAVIVAWFAAPDAALLAFLGYSASHFADDWPGPRLGALAAATCVLALPAAFHSGRVIEIFGYLGAGSDLAWKALVAAGVASAPLAAWYLRALPRAVWSLLALALLAAVVSALAYFLVYFCGLHAPGHVARVGDRLGISRTLLRREMALPAAGALAGALAGGTALLLSGIPLEAAASQATFVGFSALTVPHMLLVDAVARGRRMPEDPASGGRSGNGSLPRRRGLLR